MWMTQSRSYAMAISGIHAMTHKPCVELLEVFITPPKFNMEPENDGLEDDFPFPGVYSQVPS